MHLSPKKQNAIFFSKYEVIGKEKEQSVFGPTDFISILYLFFMPSLLIP